MRRTILAIGAAVLLATASVAVISSDDVVRTLDHDLATP